MTKKNIVLIAVGLMTLCILGVYLKRTVENQTFEDSKSKCITRPWATVPLIMPLGKPYEEHFSILSYKFPSWWVSQLDETHYKLMPIVDTIPVTHANYNKIVIDGMNVWFTYNGSLNNSLARYDTQKKEVRIYNIPGARDKPFEVPDIYLGQDGTLWAILDSPQSGGGYSVLARYQHDEDNFEIIKDLDGVFTRLQETRGGPSDKKIVEMSDGQLAIVMEGNIYLYNPATNRAKLLLSSRNIVSIATGKDNKIWFVSHYKDFNLRVMDATNGKVVDYGVPPNLGKQEKTQPELLEATKAIAVDKQGRVWVSYFDKLEPDTNGQYSWHSMKLPPIFVNTFDPYHYYRWADVFSTHVFSDGNIWFASDVGIVKYDIQNDSWCLSAEVKTFGSYPITEDADGNIWTVIDNQIYKLQP